jgi:type I restriction enzyme S subunit
VSGESVAIGTVADLIKRGISPKYSTDGMRVVNQKCIRDFRVNYDLARRHDGQQKPVKPEMYVRQFDVLVNSTGVGTLGRVAFVGEAPEEPTAVDSHVTLIRPDLSRVDGAYFGYCICALQSVIEGMGVGATGQTELSRIRLSEDLFLRLPPIEDQRLIGQILWRFDQALENNARRIEILEEMAQAIYREWFVEFRYPGHEDVPLVDSELGPIPEGWSVSDLSSVCTRMQAGGTPSRKNPEFWDDGVINWFRTTELQDGFLFDSSEKISQAGLEGSSAKMFEAGSILMAIYGSPTVGRLGVLTRDATCNQAALALVPDETFLSHPFLYQTLTSMREHFNSIAQGAAQQNISKATVAGTLMMLPPRPLVDLYDHLAVPIWDLTRTLTEELGNLHETRDMLLPKLISGEIDVSELGIELADSSL